MRNYFNKLMRGRYGFDQLGYFLIFLYFILYLISTLCMIGEFYTANFIFRNLSYCIFGYMLYRYLSKKIYKRQTENNIYLTYVYKARLVVNRYKNMWTYRKEYKYFRCPNCHKYLRVPRGKGVLTVNCPHCHSSFDKKS